MKTMKRRLKRFRGSIYMPSRRRLCSSLRRIKLKRELLRYRGKSRHTRRKYRSRLMLA